MQYIAQHVAHYVMKQSEEATKTPASALIRLIATKHKKSVVNDNDYHYT